MTTCECDKPKNQCDPCSTALPSSNTQLERGLAWLRAMAKHGARKFDKQGATVLLAGIEQLQKENASLAKVLAARMEEEREPADPAECCIFGNGSGNRCVTHQKTWATGPCPATLPSKAGEL